MAAPGQLTPPCFLLLLLSREPARIRARPPASRRFRTREKALGTFRPTLFFYSRRPPPPVAAAAAAAASDTDEDDSEDDSDARPEMCGRSSGPATGPGPRPSAGRPASPAAGASSSAAAAAAAADVEAAAEAAAVRWLPARPRPVDCRPRGAGVRGIL